MIKIKLNKLFLSFKYKFIFYLIRFQGLLLYFIFLCFYFKKYGYEKNNTKLKKDKIFIFGSSWSINEISDYEWSHIRKEGDTMSLNAFYMSEKIEIDYHVVRELTATNNFFSISSFKSIKKINDLIRRNKRFTKTTFFVMIDKISTAPLLWYILYGNKFKTILYKNLPDRLASIPLSKSFINIPHCGTTIFDCINLSFVLGYHEIILVGIDLKDSRYFYLDYEEVHPLSKEDTVEVEHPTKKIVFNNIVVWRDYLQSEGVTLSVYSNSSTLTKFLKLYNS